MSDPAWASRTLVDGHDGILYVQAAGATATPTTANELGWVSSLSFGNESEVTEKGPYLNRASKAKTISSYSSSGEVTIDVANGVDAVRDLFFTAMTNKTRLKLTYQMDPTGGEKHVFDQAVIGFTGEMNPAEGISYTFSFDSDSYTKTNATA
jgi:hypothetical protein